VKEPPRYIIEIANIPIIQGSICPKVLYRVTARGVGGVDNAIVFLQTMYRHLPASC
jgi:Tfp pilus assembly protein PilX